MDVPAFLKAVERGQVPPLVLIHGPDPLFLDDALAAVTRTLLPDPSAAAFDREVFDGQVADGEAIVNAAMTVPVMGVARLVAVRRCQELPAKASGILGRYAANPNPAACLLLLANELLTETRERKAHWLLGVVPPGAVVTLAQRKGRPLEEWVRQRASAEGIAVSEEAVQLLVQFVGEDSLALLGEVRKAALAGAPETRAVGVKEVREVVGEHRVAGAFDLVRAVERRNTAGALGTLDRLLAAEEAVRVVALLTGLVRTAWMVKVARERGQTVDQIGRTLRRPTFAVEASAAFAAAVPARTLARLLERCWEVERRLKSGGEPRAELGALVAELCGVEARGRDQRVAAAP
jgi:DNA polymerase-3 subunit delta